MLKPLKKLNVNGVDQGEVVGRINDLIDAVNDLSLSVQSLVKKSAPKAGDKKPKKSAPKAGDKKPKENTKKEGESDAKTTT